MSAWAIFYLETQISKAHSTREAAVIEAYEKKIVQRRHDRQSIAPGYTIKEVEQ